MPNKVPKCKLLQEEKTKNRDKKKFHKIDKDGNIEKSWEMKLYIL